MTREQQMDRLLSDIAMALSHLLARPDQQRHQDARAALKRFHAWRKGQLEEHLAAEENPPPSDQAAELLAWAEAADEERRAQPGYRADLDG